MAKSNRRFYRTFILGFIALGLLVWSAADQFDIPPQKMAELFFGTVWIVVFTIVTAALFATIWIGLRNWRQRNDSDNGQ